MWTDAAATGADLLWRVKSTLNPQHLETLSDGSWLARIVPTSGVKRMHTTPLTVRVIDYTIDDGRENPEEYRLLTTILDPAQAPAEDLAVAYAQRWEIESTFDELKTHQRGPRAVLRSKSPDLVQQEIWGHLCCHYAIRTLMADTATQPGEIRTEYHSSQHYASAEDHCPTAHFPPHDTDSDTLLGIAPSQTELRINPARRPRSNPEWSNEKSSSGRQNALTTAMATTAPPSRQITIRTP